MKYTDLDYRIASNFQESDESIEDGLKRVKSTPEPREQKFKIGTRVKIADDLGNRMSSRFPSGCNATVVYTYAHIFDDDAVEDYCLDVDGHGEIRWYLEHQLTEIVGDNNE